MKRLFTLCLLLSACNHLTVNQSASEVTSEATSRVVSVRSFFWGFQAQRISPTVCQDKLPQSYHFFMDGGDVALTVLTAGLYVPAEVEVTCR